jgi:hypothetical protein
MNGGNMKLHSAAVLAAALLLLPLAAFADGASGAQPGDAQAGDSQQGTAQGKAPVAAPSDGSAAESTDSNPFLPGEQTIGLSAGLHIPAFVAPVTGGGVKNIDLGGSFSFSYQYFVARGWAVGGNVAAAFNSTIGGSSIFTLPIGATGAYWWAKLPFEFTLGGEAGAYMMRENGKGMFGPFAKAGGGAYWRISPSWGVGLQANLWFVPEIHYGAYSSLSQYGGFVETSLAAVYHL